MMRIIVYPDLFWGPKFMEVRVQIPDKGRCGKVRRDSTFPAGRRAPPSGELAKCLDAKPWKGSSCEPWHHPTILEPNPYYPSHRDPSPKQGPNKAEIEVIRSLVGLVFGGCVWLGVVMGCMKLPSNRLEYHQIKATRPYQRYIRRSCMCSGMGIKSAGDCFIVVR